MPRLLKISLAILTLLLGACVRDAKVTPPQVEPQMTLSCFITPDADTVTAVVNWSKPLYQKQSNYGQPLPVRNASVLIKGLQGVLVLDKFYENEYGNTRYWNVAPEGFFQPGQTYTIEVTEPGGKFITATTTIPRRKILNLRAAYIDSSTETNSWSNNSKLFKARFELQFDDDAEPGDRYRIAGGYYLTFGTLVPDGDLFKPVKDSAFQNFYFNRNNLISDEVGNGTTFTFNTGEVQIYYVRSDSPFYDNYPGKYFYFLLYQIDEAYYRFQQYAQNYTGDNPFAEPLPMPSNVKGGFGIFGSYVKHITTLNYR